MAKAYNDIYPDGNAASKFNPALSLWDWTPSGGGTLVADNTAGEYSLISTYIGPTGGEFAQINPFAVVSGVEYTFKMDVFSDVGNVGKIQIWEGFITSPSETVPEGVWTSYSFTLTANQNSAIIRFYQSTANQIGGKMKIKNFEILDSSIPAPITNRRADLMLIKKLRR